MNELITTVQNASRSLDSGKTEEAVEAYRQALQLAPDNPQIMVDLGTALLVQGEVSEACDCFLKAVQHQPDFAAAHYNLGLAYSRLGQNDLAECGYKQALAIQPNLWCAHVNLGNLYNKKNDPAQAIACYRRALHLKPNHINTLVSMAILLRNQGQPEQALPLLSHAQKQDSTHVAVYEHLGLTLIDMLYNQEALACFQAWHRLTPDAPDAHCCIGAAYNLLGQYDKAIEHYEHAIALDTNHASARWNRALLLLLKGQWTEGWAEFKWRWQIEARSSIYAHVYNQPPWAGETLDEGTLFVHYEQGLGDVLQFMRYLPMVKKKVANLIFEVPKPIYALVKEWPCLDAVLISNRQKPVTRPFDRHISLMDLPHLFETTLDSLPNQVPYVHAHPEKIKDWKRRFSDTHFCIGIVWAGGQVHHARVASLKLRACRLEHFAPLASLQNVQLYGLQKGPTADEVNSKTEAILQTNFGPEFIDFTDTAAAIANLDLIISVDTSVAHLAGAMGKPTWTLLKHDADWRWLLNRDDSPWYPTMRLFRQSQNEDWPAVIKRLFRALQGHLSGANRP